LQVFLMLCVLATAAFAASPSELGARARERFEVLPLREGVLLKPLHKSDYSVIEITGEGVAIDGEELSGRSLRRRLGDDAEVVQDIADLDESELREVALGGEVEHGGMKLDAPPAAPAPPGAPAVPAPSAVPAAPAPPEPPREPRAPRSPRRHSDAKVSVASSAHVEHGETSQDVFVFGGEVIVDGDVDGDAVAIGGEVKVDGRVSGNVVSVGGDVVLGPNADIDGDVTSVGGHIQKDPGARIGGRTSEVAMGPLLRTGALGRLGRHARVDLEPFERVARLLSSGFRLVLFALFGCLVILLAREPLERVADKVGEEVWRCGLIGLISPFLIFPLLIITIVVLAVSVVGIPLLVLIPFAILALVVGGFLGYTAVALQIGRWAERRFGWNLGSPYLAVFVGLLCLQGWTLAGRALDWDVTPFGFFSGLLLFTGFVLQMIAALIGFGAVLVTRFGTYAVWRGWRWHRPDTMPAWSGSGYGAPVSPPPPPPSGPAEGPIAAEDRPPVPSEAVADTDADRPEGESEGETKPGS
jgi:hypothetical protein